MQSFLTMLRFGLLTLVGLNVPLPSIAQQPSKPYQVRIVGEKDQFAENSVPADPKVKTRYKGNMTFGATLDGRKLAENIQTLFMIDGKVVKPFVGGRLQELPMGPAKVKRHGGETVSEQHGIRMTMTLEAISSKGMESKAEASAVRRKDTLLVKYSMENLSMTTLRKVGCRVVLDNFVIGKEVVRFASPTTHPNRLLNAVQFENKGVPSFIEALERSNLKDPGFKAIVTFRLNDKILEGPNRVVLTTTAGINSDMQWDVVAEEEGNASVAVLYWEHRDLKPQTKREFAYAYGQGIAMVKEGRFSAEFGGSFGPGKSFTIAAYVDGPADGQTLTLQLPEGIERIGGKVTQVVPLASETTGQSVVMWRCRLARVGSFPIRIRSSNGLTQAWTVTVSPPD